jgi:phosphoenolpyruvate synthase/pyruvate phosphate dikinase
VAAPLPAEIERAIVEAYDALAAESHEHVDVAVRSSATAED